MVVLVVVALFATLLAICVVLVVYPYVIYPLVLRTLPSKPVALTGEEPGSLSLLFCAFNEGSALQGKLANIEHLKARHPDLEVLAYNDASTDDTLDLLRSRPDLLSVLDGVGRHGKAHGMKQLAARATGEVLVFTDANVLLRDDAIDNLLAWYRDPSVGGVCGALEYVNSGDSATASVGATYWTLEEKLKSLESRTGNVMGADGSIFSIRAPLYPDFPDTVLDDLTVSMASVLAGTRLIKVDDVVAYERLVAGRDDEFARKIRIAARAFHTHLYLRPQLKRMSGLDKFKYGSRKLVRWFGGLFVILGLVFTIALAAVIALWAGLVTLLAVALAAYVVPKIGRGPVGAIADTLLALLATFIGVTRAIRGQTVVTWSPAKSR